MDVNGGFDPETGSVVLRIVPPPSKEEEEEDSYLDVGRCVAAGRCLKSVFGRWKTASKTEKFTECVYTISNYLVLRSKMPKRVHDVCHQTLRSLGIFLSHNLLLWETDSSRQFKPMKGTNLEDLGDPAETLVRFSCVDEFVLRKALCDVYMLVHDCLDDRATARAALQLCVWVLARVNMHKANTHKANLHKTNTHKTNTHKTNPHKTNTHKTNTHKTNPHKTHASKTWS